LAQHYIDKPPSYSTVLRWVHRMGLSYKTQSKSYMVDGHENEEQRAHRDQHTRFYLAELELKTHRWIQLTEDEYAKLSFQVLAKPVEYTDDVTGKKMFQFHVDDHEELQALANKKYGEFGGNVHYTWKGKPVIIFGQDESTFNQYAFGNKLWVGSNGERAFLPKHNGMGLMISAFQSREFGFGFDMTPDELARVNHKRKGKSYEDTVAAMDVRGSEKKEPLLESPFVVKLEYGANKDGYWTGNHMILQLEDCIDCLTELHGDKYDFYFQFDHSSGHAKAQLNGLDVSNMNKGFGGDLLRATLIKGEDGYLGSFYNSGNKFMVTINEEQKLVWGGDLPDDAGPFWMTPTERLARKFDTYEDLPTDKHRPRNKTKDELVDEILTHEFGQVSGTRDELKKKLLPDLQDLAKKFNIEVAPKVTRKKIPGWYGKGKGLMQVSASGLKP